MIVSQVRTKLQLSMLNSTTTNVYNKLFSQGPGDVQPDYNIQCVSASTLQNGVVAVLFFVFKKDTFISLIEEFGECLFGNATTGLFEDPILGSWHAYVDVYFDNIDCLSDIEMDYDDYCIESFNYEEIFQLDAGCTSEAPYVYLGGSRTNLWHLDEIDGTKNNYYNYYSYNDNSGIDIYILDTGIRTTHQEFDGINVGNHDWGYDNDEITQSHGTHVAGIAAGKRVGVHRGAKNIYSFAVCRSAFWGCFEQDIEAGLKMVDRALEKRPTKYRRAVINMSWGGKSESDRGHLNSYIQRIYNSGGIMVAAAGNSAEDACSHWPSSLEWVIAVGAYNEDYEVAWFSNYGKCFLLLVSLKAECLVFRTSLTLHNVTANSQCEHIVQTYQIIHRQQQICHHISLKINNTKSIFVSFVFVFDFGWIYT